MPKLTKILKPFFSKITYHCIGSVGLGIIAATVIAFGIIGWSEKNDNPVTAATYNIRLPQDSDLLKKLSDELLEGTDVTDTQKLTDIAPAAGSNSLSK